MFQWAWPIFWLVHVSILLQQKLFLVAASMLQTLKLPCREGSLETKTSTMGWNKFCRSNLIFKMSLPSRSAKLVKNGAVTSNYWLRLALKLLYCMNVTCESFFLSCFAIIIGLGRPKCLAYWDFHETFFQFHHFLKLKIVKSIFYHVGTLQKTAQP